MCELMSVWLELQNKQNGKVLKERIEKEKHCHTPITQKTKRLTKFTTIADKLSAQKTLEPSAKTSVAIGSQARTNRRGLAKTAMT